MDPKQQAQRNKQRERQERGHDFQLEIKRSWEFVPNTWSIPIKDGLGGTKPADRLTLAEEVNLLTELKRTAKQEFQLSFLRPNQIHGLLDFDGVVKRNYGLVLVSFYNPPKMDEAYAIRLVTAMQYMVKEGKKSISLEALRNGVRYKDRQVAIRIPRLETAEKAFDLREVVECYKYL